MDIATCMYHTGLDPMTMQPVETVKKLKDREVQRALMQFFKPENWFVVHRALLEAGRKDLIGPGPQCLIKAEPPKEALQARRDGASGRRRGDPTYVHAKDAGVKGRGGLPCAPGDDEEE
jgi:hypothetical protein